ncbi:hypothetical protein [Streptomyces sp. NPDC059349]|uniref:hypothetical protein n=1 Tax=Streptomyces sp. NPDC059349 TaxID=3346808 RepID=UPI0036834EAC
MSGVLGEVSGPVGPLCGCLDRIPDAFSAISGMTAGRSKLMQTRVGTDSKRRTMSLSSSSGKSSRPEWKNASNLPSRGSYGVRSRRIASSAAAGSATTSP